MTGVTTAHMGEQSGTCWVAKIWMGMVLYSAQKDEMENITELVRAGFAEFCKKQNQVDTIMTQGEVNKCFLAMGNKPEDTKAKNELRSMLRCLFELIEVCKQSPFALIRSTFWLSSSSLIHIPLFTPEHSFV